LGDTAAFKELYNYYHPQLYRFSLRYVKSPFLAEEVVHDVFVKVWENRHTLDESRSIRSYLYTICKNHMLNVLARAARERQCQQQMVHFARLAQEHVSRHYHGHGNRPHGQSRPVHPAVRKQKTGITIGLLMAGTFLL